MQRLNFTNTIFSFIFLFTLSSVFANNSAQNPCNETYDAGFVGQDQVLCLSDNIPSKINNIEAAANGATDFEYLWIYATADPNVGTVIWLSIPGATQIDYQPSALYQTTWFRRCTRPLGCDVFGEESNTVKITVEICAEPCLTFGWGNKDAENLTCHNNETGRIEVQVIGGEAPFIYNWSHTENHDPIQENLAAGTYEVVVSDANGCVLTENFELTAPDEIKVTSIKGNATCNGASDGFFELEMEGGTAPFSFEMEDKVFEDASFENLMAGTYEVKIIDANGCIENIEIVIEAPQKLEVFSTVFNETCVQNDGSINVEIIGGTAPYDINWNTGANNQIVENIPAGNYYLSVIDANDCLAWHEVRIEDTCEELMIDYQQNMLHLMPSNKVEINWTTFNEKEGGVYLIERSLDGNEFELASESFAGNGYNEQGSVYQIMDENPKNGMNYYRVVHISATGDFSITNSFFVFIETEDMPQVSIFPNPVVNEISVDFLRPTIEKIELELVDVFGQVVSQNSLEAGKRFYDMNVENLPGGSYFLMIQRGTEKLIIKQFIKE